MIWNRPMECADRETMRALQLKKLQATVKRVYQNVEPYRLRMQEKGIKPGDIQSLDDLKYLPFTTKADLRDNYPYGMFSAPLSEIVRIHASSGTTGKPTVVGYTRNDLEMWNECVARALCMAGGSKHSVVQVAYGYGLFTGGLGAHGGAEYIGASVIPMSSGNTQKQVMLMKDFRSTILCCTPSYAAYIGETCREMGVDTTKIPLRAGLFGAEAWSEGMRENIERLLNIDAYDIYGLSEIAGPGVAYECREKQGLHVCEDYFYPEIIDPDTGEVLPDGEYGELVFTCIGKEALPLIRYRTRDISALVREKCACGRTVARLKKLKGRTDDMLIIRGVNVFPSQIETVLLEQGYPVNYQIIVDRVNNSDTLEVQVEMSPEMFSDQLSQVAEQEKQLVNALKAMLGIYAKVRLVAPKSIQRSEGKAVRLIDKRKI